VESVRAGGVPGGDVARRRRRLAAAVAALTALPADGIGLAALAADVLGDPHALDRGRALATLVLDAVAAARGRPRPADAEAARWLWEEVGVVPDPLSSTVLALALPLAMTTRSVRCRRRRRRSPPCSPLPAAAVAGRPPALGGCGLHRGEPFAAGRSGDQGLGRATAAVQLGPADGGRGHPGPPAPGRRRPTSFSTPTSTPPAWASPAGWPSGQERSPGAWARRTTWPPWPPPDNGWPWPAGSRRRHGIRAWSHHGHARRRRVRGGDPGRPAVSHDRRPGHGRTVTPGRRPPCRRPIRRRC